MITKSDLHRFRYILTTTAYETFDENNGQQRFALSEIISEVDRLLKKADEEFEEVE
jgi:hypothetical protein